MKEISLLYYKNKNLGLNTLLKSYSLTQIIQKMLTIHFLINS